MFDAAEGWTHFVRPVDAAERLWEGEPEASASGGEPEAIATIDVAQFDDWLKARGDAADRRAGQPDSQRRRGRRAVRRNA